tara:strand:- start:250 stop:750 length:501 start_codon:yes stop_codon:yes gene_type:complete
MEFGQVINPEYDPSKNHLYKAFHEYFNNPILTKIKNVNNFTVYMAKIHAMLGNSFRYLILFVNRDVNNTGTEKRMEELDWVSLQTRTLEDQHDLKAHSYQVRQTPSLSNKINIDIRSEEQSTYDVDGYPITVTLLHTRKNNTYQYQATGTVVSALETYQTIINFKN